MTTVVSCQIQHRVHFAPNPENPSFGTEPYIVATRLVCDVPKFPPKVKYMFFDDVVETVVSLPDGTLETLYSKPINKETFFVQWDEVSRQKVLANNRPGEVSVHPDLQGKVWVIASQQQQLAGQKAV